MAKRVKLVRTTDKSHHSGTLKNFICMAPNIIEFERFTQENHAMPAQMMKPRISEIRREQGHTLLS
jgi:hypothetical protein